MSRAKVNAVHASQPGPCDVASLAPLDLGFVVGAFPSSSAAARAAPPPPPARRPPAPPPGPGGEGVGRAVLPWVGWSPLRRRAAASAAAARSLAKTDLPSHRP